ncbi:MAG: Ankyrin repeat domain-containing protein 60 [Claussenomyces sp. TS43310]|nr:MAG: Ankyrin repeat domain-containing protein 60 [Claussenomyces sp. TS43310]
MDRLPYELVEMIIDSIIPRSWNDSKHGRSVLYIRLVCKTWDQIASRCAFRKLNFRKLKRNDRCMNDHTATWLLVNKMRHGRDAHHESFATTLCHAAQSMVSWQTYSSETSLYEDEHWETACAVAVAFRGKSWVVDHLRTFFRGVWDLTDCPAPCLPGRAGNRYPPCHHDLPVAAYHGDKSIVEALLNGGAKVNTSDNYLGSALYAAAYRGNTDLLSLLLHHRANVNICGTPLHAAADQGHEEVIQMLLDKGANVNGEGERNCLLAASGKGHERAVQVLLARFDINTNFQDSFGMTPLLLAVRYGYQTVARRLLEHPMVNPNLQNELGESPLLWAASRGDTATVQLLLERNEIDPNPRDIHLQTPLGAAAEKGHEAVVALLVQHKDFGPNTRYWTHDALSQAKSKGHKGIVDLLLPLNKGTLGVDGIYS